MRINHNLMAMSAYKNVSYATSNVSSSVNKLSSGQRINNAADDAAGLAISEKMRGQIRGLEQASRNAQDGISLIQTAEGGLNEVHSLLQRGRELSVYASNDTLTDDDRKEVQKEVDQIKEEVDKIANNTEFNTIKLLNRSGASIADQQAILDNLQKGWLAASESLVINALGIGGGGTGIKIELKPTLDGAGGTLAQVGYSYVPGVSGPGSNLTLQIDMSDFAGTTYPDGGGWIAFDRVIAHEMVHAVTAATINVGTGMETWFMEGLAEAVHGADERLNGTLGSLSGSVSSLVNLISNGSWSGTSDAYSASYAAIRYMDYAIVNNGGAGVKDVVSYMAANPNDTLNNAISLASSGAFNGVADFMTKFKSAGAGGGQNYVTTQLLPNLANGDTGSLIGSDRNGGGITYNDADIVNETMFGTITNNPMTSFTETWPLALEEMSSSIKSHVGANAGQSTDIALADVTATTLGIATINVTTQSGADNAITSFDNAIRNVSAARARFGAMQNRLEHTINNLQTTSENLVAAESRIRDVDMAKEMMNFTKNNVIVQAAQSMLAQANQVPQGVLQLLR